MHWGWTSFLNLILTNNAEISQNSEKAVRYVLHCQFAEETYNFDSDSALLQNESLKKAEAHIQTQEAEVNVLFKLKVIVKDNVLQFVEQRNFLFVFKFGHSSLKSNLGKEL